MGRNKRFKILRTAIRKYKAPVSTPGTPFYVFDQFDKGLADFHPEQPDRGAQEERKAKPFAVPATSDPYVIQRSSTRALETGLASTGLSLADLAVSDVLAADTVTDNPNYIPAKIVVFNPTGTTRDVSAAQNKVTGTPYKRRNGSSYTLPFGQGATPGTTLLVAMGYLSDKADAAGKTVTFKPERFYGNGS